MATSEIELRSKQAILGAMIARIKALTDINDFSEGSVVRTMLESAALSDFLQEAKLVQLLNIKSIDKATGVDLERLAYEVGLDQTRLGASSASVFLTIKDSAFNKTASNIYAGATAPAAGDTTIKIVNGQGFGSSGTIYIGRGTQNSEAVSYISRSPATEEEISNQAYCELTLASPLTKNHLVGEEVVLSSNTGDRTIRQGTQVSAKAQSGGSKVLFSIQQTVTLLDGEDTIKDVLAIAATPGAQGNVGKNKVSSFESAPWSTATVTNPDAARGGRDAETDSELRVRIKDRAHALSGGTERALIRGVVGVSDDEENKRVTSAYLRKPTKAGDPTILFIDDGTGFSPTFSGIGEEISITKANGGESFIQLQKWPLVKAQIGSVLREPFALSGGESLYIEIDGEAEEQELPTGDFRNPGIVTAQEVSEAINKAFKSVEARAKDGQVFITPVANEPNYIRVGSSTLSSVDANSILRFPTTKQYTLKLYKNDRLLEMKGSNALIQSLKNTAWSGLADPAHALELPDYPSDTRESLKLRVDGIESPLVYYTDLDFKTYAGVSKLKNASASDWAKVINRTFIGVTATAGDNGTFSIQSNRGLSDSAEISVIGGTLATKLFPIGASSTGKTPEYKLNRLLGQIELSERLTAGDEIKAGSTQTRGFIASLAEKVFNLAGTTKYDDSTTLPGEIILVADAPVDAVDIAQSGSLSFAPASTQGCSLLTGSSSQFSNVKSDDWIHLYNTPRSGLFRVASVSEDGSEIEFYDPAPVTGTLSALDGIKSKVTAFRTEGLPQLLTFPQGGTVQTSEIITAISDQILGVSVSEVDQGGLKVSTDRFSGEGALAIASVAGSAKNLGFSEGNAYSNDPHVASMESDLLTGTAHGRIALSGTDLTSPKLKLLASNAPFTDEASYNETLEVYNGSLSGHLLQPETKSSSSQLVLRDEFPLSSNDLGVDLSAVRVSGLEFGQSDNMVFVIDADASTKTFDIPMYIDAVISGPSVPSTNEFDLADSIGSLFGISSRWSGLRLEDYRVWFQARADLPSTDASAQLRIKSVQFGPNGENIEFGCFYPSAPNTQAQVAFENDVENSKILVRLMLESGRARLIGLQSNHSVQVKKVNGTTVRYWFLPPVDLSLVVPGDVLNLNDQAFESENQGSARITSVSNYVDSGHTVEFVKESISVVVDSNQTSVTLSSAPSKTLRVGDVITLNSVSRAVTAVTSQTEVTVASPGFTPSATAQSAFLSHKNLTLSGIPQYTVAVGDRISIGQSLLTITNIVSQTEFEVDQPFLFEGAASAQISRLYLECAKLNAGSDETHSVSSSQSLRVYELPVAKNKASTLSLLINNTAGIKDIISASSAPESSGEGSILKSTEDELLTGGSRVALQNGESFVEIVRETSPALKIKVPTTLTPELGERVRLVPTTARNIFDHFSRKQISGLSSAADVALVDRGRRVQVSSKTPGGFGQVDAVGGRASGQNVLPIRASGQSFSDEKGFIELDRSSVEFLIPGHTVKLYQSGRAKKQWTDQTPGATTTLEITQSSTAQGTLTLSVPLVKIFDYEQTGDVVFITRRIGRSRLRFELVSGVGILPNELKLDDWVLIGNGESYAGIDTTREFAPANQGWFQVIETDNATYFDVENESGIEERVTAQETSFVFTSYHSARVGDQIVLGPELPIESVNQGTFEIVSVPSATSVVYSNPRIQAQTQIPIGVSAVTPISVLDQGYVTTRTVEMVSLKASDPTRRSIVVLTPGYGLSAFAEGQGAKLSLPNRLNYGRDPVPGASGYLYWTGLKRKVQRTIDGYEPDSQVFPGIGAAGVSIEAREPQIQRISLSMKIKTSKGVSLQAISDVIKSAVQGYVNSLGLGQDVILSEIIKTVQEVTGVEACVLTYPSPTLERKTIGDSAIANLAAKDITIS